MLAADPSGPGVVLDTESGEAPLIKYRYLREIERVGRAVKGQLNSSVITYSGGERDDVWYSIIAERCKGLERELQGPPTHVRSIISRLKAGIDRFGMDSEASSSSDSIQRALKPVLKLLEHPEEDLDARFFLNSKKSGLRRAVIEYIEILILGTAGLRDDKHSQTDERFLKEVGWSHKTSGENTKNTILRALDSLGQKEGLKFGPAHKREKEITGYMAGAGKPESDWDRERITAEIIKLKKQIAVLEGGESVAPSSDRGDAKAGSSKSHRRFSLTGRRKSSRVHEVEVDDEPRGAKEARLGKLEKILRERVELPKVRKTLLSTGPYVYLDPIMPVVLGTADDVAVYNEIGKMSFALSEASRVRIGAVVKSPVYKKTKVKHTDSDGTVTELDLDQLIVEASKHEYIPREETDTGWGFVPGWVKKLGSKAHDFGYKLISTEPEKDTAKPKDAGEWVVWAARRAGIIFGISLPTLFMISPSEIDELHSENPLMNKKDLLVPDNLKANLATVPQRTLRALKFVVLKWHFGFSNTDAFKPMTKAAFKLLLENAFDLVKITQPEELRRIEIFTSFNEAQLKQIFKDKEKSIALWQMLSVLWEEGSPHITKIPHAKLSSVLKYQDQFFELVGTVSNPKSAAGTVDPDAKQFIQHLFNCNAGRVDVFLRFADNVLELKKKGVEFDELLNPDLHVQKFVRAVAQADITLQFLSYKGVKFSSYVAPGPMSASSTEDSSAVKLMDMHIDDLSWLYIHHKDVATLVNAGPEAIKPGTVTKGKRFKDIVEAPRWRRLVLLRFANAAEFLLTGTGGLDVKKTMPVIWEELMKATPGQLYVVLKNWESIQNMLRVMGTTDPKKTKNPIKSLGQLLTLFDPQQLGVLCELSDGVSSEKPDLPWFIYKLAEPAPPQRLVIPVEHFSGIPGPKLRLIISNLTELTALLRLPGFHLRFFEELPAVTIKMCLEGSTKSGGASRKNFYLVQEIAKWSPNLDLKGLLSLSPKYLHTVLLRWHQYNRNETPYNENELLKELRWVQTYHGCYEPVAASTEPESDEPSTSSGVTRFFAGLWDGLKKIGHEVEETVVSIMPGSEPAAAAEPEVTKESVIAENTSAITALKEQGFTDGQIKGLSIGKIRVICHADPKTVKALHDKKPLEIWNEIPLMDFKMMLINPASLYVDNYKTKSEKAKIVEDKIKGLYEAQGVDFAKFAALPAGYQKLIRDNVTDPTIKDLPFDGLEKCSIEQIKLFLANGEGLEFKAEAKQFMERFGYDELKLSDVLVLRKTEIAEMDLEWLKKPAAKTEAETLGRFYDNLYKTALFAIAFNTQDLRLSADAIGMLVNADEDRRGAILDNPIKFAKLFKESGLSWKYFLGKKAAVTSDPTASVVLVTDEEGSLICSEADFEKLMGDDRAVKAPIIAAAKTAGHERVKTLAPGLVSALSPSVDTGSGLGGSSVVPLSDSKKGPPWYLSTAAYISYTVLGLVITGLSVYLLFFNKGVEEQEIEGIGK